MLEGMAAALANIFRPSELRIPQGIIPCASRLKRPFPKSASGDAWPAGLGGTTFQSASLFRKTKTANERSESRY